MRPTKKMQNRMAILMSLLAVGFVVVIAQISRINLYKGEQLQDRALNQQLQDTIIAANRGDITDRNGTVMATSNTVWNVYISPADIKKDETRQLIARGLSEILGVDYNEVLEKANRTNYYQSIKKQVEKEDVDKVLAFASENGIAAIHTEEASKRYYPYNDLAAPVLGFVGSDNQGLNGIESYFDRYLAGTDGRSVTMVNAKSEELDYEYQKLYDARDGDTVKLTIDYNIQSIVEKYLKEAVKEHNTSKKGAAIAVNVKTGEILAMATEPDFDPNQPFVLYDPEAQKRVDAAETDEEKASLRSQEQNYQWRNKVISSIYEPGSTFKIITGAAALEEGAATLGTHYNCPGYTVVAGVRIKCTSFGKGGHGNQNLTEIFKNSCNPGFMAAGAALGAEKFCNYLESFGLTQKTGIELPGEENGLTVALKDMGPVELASSSFGQTSKITMLQLAMACSAAVNGGYLYEPQIVSQIVDVDGNIVKDYEPVLVRQVVSEDTSAKIATILDHVVSDKDGGGKNAYVEGYAIGGKSGTAQKLDSDNENAYIASFLACAPTDDPEILILMILDESDSYSIYGSNLVAPYVGKMMSDILPYIGVAAEFDDDQETVSRVVGKTKSAAESTLVKKGFKVNVVGSGDTVVSQFPAGGTVVGVGSTITLYTDADSSAQTVTVPNFVGYSPSTVNQIANNNKLNLKIIGASNGSTTVSVSQNIAKGEEVQIGTVIEVVFREQVAGD